MLDQLFQLDARNVSAAPRHLTCLLTIARHSTGSERQFGVEMGNAATVSLGAHPIPIGFVH